MAYKKYLWIFTAYTTAYYCKHGAFGNFLNWKNTFFLLSYRYNIAFLSHVQIRLLSRTVLCALITGSLPPSPADSGVSDVDSSSSGHTSTDELKARLQPSIHSPVGTLFPRHPFSWNNAHQRPPSHMSQQFYQPFHSSKYCLFQILTEISSK